MSEFTISADEADLSKRYADLRQLYDAYQAVIDRAEERIKEAAKKEGVKDIHAEDEDGYSFYDVQLLGDPECNLEYLWIRQGSIQTEISRVFDRLEQAAIEQDHWEVCVPETARGIQ